MPVAEPPPRPEATSEPAPIPPSAVLPPYRELADIRPIAVPVDRPAFWGGQVTRLTLKSAEPPRRPRPLLPGTAEFTAPWLANWHDVADGWPARDVACYFAQDVVVTAGGEIWLDQQLLTTPELMAGYTYSLVLGLPDGGDAFVARSQQPIRDIDPPCVVMPGGPAVFGHFLIEIMLYVLSVERMLLASGLNSGYLVRDDAPGWFRRMLNVDLGIAAERLVYYSPNAERIRLRHAILPTMVHRGDGFHPYAAELLAELLNRIEMPPPPLSTRRLFLSRVAHVKAGLSIGNRACVNESALVADAVARHGFVAVALEAYPWREQIALMRNAEMVAGLFGSAMHSTMYAPPGTRVVCVGLGNLVQSEIGALWQHDMAYMTEGVDVSASYSVDEAAFARFLDAACA